MNKYMKLRALRTKQAVAKAGQTILGIVQFRVTNGNDSGVGDKRNSGATGEDECKSLLACNSSSALKCVSQQKKLLLVQGHLQDRHRGTEDKRAEAIMKTASNFLTD